MPKYKVTLCHKSEATYVINAEDEGQALERVRKGDGTFLSQSGLERNEDLDAAEAICSHCWETLYPTMVPDSVGIGLHEELLCRNPECGGE